MKIIAYSMWAIGTFILAVYPRNDDHVGFIYIANVILIYGGLVLAESKEAP